MEIDCFHLMDDVEKVKPEIAAKEEEDQEKLPVAPALPGMRPKMRGAAGDANESSEEEEAARDTLAVALAWISWNLLKYHSEASQLKSIKSSDKSPNKSLSFIPETGKVIQPSDIQAHQSNPPGPKLRMGMIQKTFRIKWLARISSDILDSIFFEDMIEYRID